MRSGSTPRDRALRMTGVIAAAVLLVVAGLALSGCGSTASSGSMPSYSVGSDGVAEVKMSIINTKYVPDAVTVPAGRPVRLLIDRRETVPCSAQFQVPKINLLVDLPPNAVTTVDLPALDPGTYPMTCGMNMMSGSITAVAGSK